MISIIYINDVNKDENLSGKIENPRHKINELEQ
jgi:hypothetical protein